MYRKKLRKKIGIEYVWFTVGSGSVFPEADPRIRNTDFMDKIIDQMKVNPGQDIDRQVSTDRRNGRNGKNGQTERTQWKERTDGNGRNGQKERTDGTYWRNLKTERSDGTDERIELIDRKFGQLCTFVNQII